MKTRLFYACSLTLALAAGTTSAQSPQDANAPAARIPYSELADQYVAAHDARDAIALVDILDGRHYVRVTLGTLDLRYPASYLGEKANAEEFKHVAQLLLDFQGEWMKWKDSGRDGYEQATRDLAKLAKWVKGWSSRKLGKCEGGDAGTLYDQLDAKKDVIEAAERLATFLGPDEETWLMLGDVHRMVFAPDRRHFLELAAVAGWLNSGLRNYYWADTWAAQPSMWIDWNHVVALEDSAWPVDYENPFLGADINVREKTLFDQRVVDRAAATLIRALFYETGQHFFESALNTNLVIATVGKNDLYVEEWSNRVTWTGETKGATSRFVPGGNPSGGVLPKNKAGLGSVNIEADTRPRWRKNDGEDYFVKALREGQKDGAKAASKDDSNPLRGDGTVHFELRLVEDGRTTVVTAPFFGPDAVEKPLPDYDFLDDYEEFFRAYRSAFAHWMQTRAVGADEEASQKKFGELIEKHATRTEDTPFYEVVEDVYGVPLSDGTPECFEMRFLAWLADQ